MLMLPLFRVKHVIHISHEMIYLNKTTVTCSCCLGKAYYTQLRLYRRIRMNFIILKELCLPLDRKKDTHVTIFLKGDPDF